MILMQAPASNQTFGAMPSGATYVSDQFGLVKIVNNSPADQVALQNAGCFTLTPFGGWGTFGFNLLSDLYTADAGAILPGITGFPQHTIASVFNDVASNNGTWTKTGAGNGVGNWTLISLITLAELANGLRGPMNFAEVSGSPFTLTGAWRLVTTTTTSTKALIVGDAAEGPSQHDIFWTSVPHGAAAPSAAIKGLPVGQIERFLAGVPVGDLYLRSDSGAIASVETGA